MRVPCCLSNIDVGMALATNGKLVSDLGAPTATMHPGASITIPEPCKGTQGFLTGEGSPDFPIGPGDLTSRA